MTEKRLKRPLLILDTIHTTHTVQNIYVCVERCCQCMVASLVRRPNWQLMEKRRIYQCSENRQLIPHGTFIHCSSPIIHAPFLFYFLTYLVENLKPISLFFFNLIECLTDKYILFFSLWSFEQHWKSIYVQTKMWFSYLLD